MSNQHSKDLRDSQNFLHDDALVQKIVNLANIPLGAFVLEVGSGEGIITRHLAQTVGQDGRVISVELDRRLADKLHNTFQDMPQVEIVNANILDYDLSTIGDDYSVFANVPFNITSILLERLFTSPHAPLIAHLILQKDTLTGITRDGYVSETVKSLMIKPFYEMSIVYTFKPTDFIPPPSIDTALFAFTKRTTPLISLTQVELYKDFLAYVSKDRVGEGVWKRAFSKKQLTRLTAQTQLVSGRGIKSQSLNAIVEAFQIFLTLNQSKHHIITGAMSKLREEQQRREQINYAGGHHTSRQRKPNPRR